MRKWLILAGILITLGLLLPVGFGVHVKYLLDELNGLHIPLQGGEMGTLEFTVVDAKQGWFYSSADIIVGYRHPHNQGNESSQEAIAILNAPATIFHGPILRQKTEEGIAWMLGQALIEADVHFVTENLPPRFLEITGTEAGEVSAFVTMPGEQIILVDSAEIDFQDEAGQFNFSGIDLEIERSNDGKKLAADAIIPHFNFLLYPQDETKHNVRWLMDGISFQFIGSVDHPSALWYGTWFGEVEVLINNAQIDMDNEHFAINQLALVNLQLPENNDSILKGESEIEFEHLVYNQNGYGPFEAIFTYENINRNAVETLRELYESWLYVDTQLSFREFLTVQQREEFNQALMSFVNQLPVYQMNNLFLVTDQGNLIAKFDARIMNKAHSIEELDGLNFWHKNLQANLEVRASQALTQDFTATSVKQIYELLNLPAPKAPNGATANIDYNGAAENLINQAKIFGIIKSINDEYETDMQLEKGRLIINGKPFIDLNQSIKKEGKTSEQLQK